MTFLFYPTREAARACKLGRYVDNGPHSPKGQRYARAVPLKGNAKQRRQQLRAMLRTAS